MSNGADGNTNHGEAMRVLLLTLVLLTAAAFPHTAVARTEGIAVVVNDDAVSVSDLDARMKLILVSSGMPDTDEIRKKMEPQIINSLIEERLMMQEAARLSITVPPEEIEKGFEQIAGQNNMPAGDFKKLLARSGIPTKTLSDQIEAQLAWSQVIQVKLRPEVSITQGQVDAMLQKFQGDIGKPRFLVSEIFLPVENTTDESAAHQLADRLVRQMTEGRIPFQKIASQFSQAAGASRGGDLGWVQQGQLPEQLDQTLSRMNEGELSQPIRSLTGYHILLLRKKNALTGEAMPSREEILSKIGIEQLERLQRRHLLDLKSDAFIERRV